MAAIIQQCGAAASVGALAALAAHAAGMRGAWRRAGAGLIAALVFVSAPFSAGARTQTGVWLPMLAAAMAGYTVACHRGPAWLLFLSGVCACWALAHAPAIALWAMCALLAMHGVDLWQRRHVSGVYTHAGWLVLLFIWVQPWRPGYDATSSAAFVLNCAGMLALLVWGGMFLRAHPGVRHALAFGAPVVLGVLLFLTLNETGHAAAGQLHACRLVHLVSYSSWRPLVGAVSFGPASAALLGTAIVYGAWQCRRAWPGLVAYIVIVLLAALGTCQPPQVLICLHLGLAALAGIGSIHIIVHVLAVPGSWRHHPRMKHCTSSPFLLSAFSRIDWQMPALCAALVILCALVFSNTLYNQFQLDDFYSITDNPGIQRVHPVWRHFLDPRTISTIASTVQYRPLLPLTLSLNYAWHGYSLPGYHIFSIAVHAVSAVMCFLLLQQLLRCWEGAARSLTRRAIAWWAAALYAVHPIAGFPVNYLIARDLLMMQMFLLAALYVYVRMRLDGGARWRWPLCVVLFLLSLCSKTNAVAAPGMVILIEYVVLREPLSAWRAWRRVGIWVAVTAGFLAWVRFGVGFSDAEQLLGGNRSTYLLTQCRIHVFNYLRNYFWPFEIRALPWVPEARSVAEWRVALGALVITGSMVAALVLMRRRPLVSFCILAYWGMAALESSIFPLHIIATDYRTYPSLPYLCLLTVLALAHLPWRRVAQAVLAGVMLYYAASSFYMNTHFRTGETFWRQSVRYGTHALGTMNYGMSLRGKDDAEALTYLQRAVELNPYYYLGRINLGLCYLSLGRREEGIAEATFGAACAPEKCKDLAYFWLSQAYKAAGDVTQAYEAVRTALTYNQHNIEYLYEGAWLAQQVSDHVAASAYLSNLHTRVENYNISRFMAGWSYQARGMNEAALAEYVISTNLTPAYAQTYANMGYALYELGRYEEAARMFEEHLRRVPNHAGSRISLSNCLERLRQHVP